MKENKRIDFLDAIRGIACLLVMTQHIFERLYREFAFFNLNYMSIGIMGVVSFFLVSGFVIPLSLEKSGSIKKFLTNRFFRIYPLYLFILFFTLMFLTFKGQKFSLSAVLLNATLLQEYLKQPVFVGVSWTLSLEIVWYVVFAITFYFSFNKKTLYLLAASSIGMIVLAFISLLIETRLPMGRVGYIHSCAVGLLFYRYFSGEVSRKEFFCAFSFSWLSMAFAFAVTYGYFTHPMFSVTCIFSSWIAGYALFLFFFILKSKEYHSMFKYFGKISYSIYLVHTLLIGVYFHYFEETLFNAFLVFIQVVLVSHFTFHFIESKGIQFAKNLDIRY